MKLLGVPDATGKPTIWINADHLVSVSSVLRGGASGVLLDAELKVDGMPLYRVPLGEHATREAAEERFRDFLNQLQA